jgi:surface polysaccharide O-acyltransferase-like enzyme
MPIIGKWVRNSTEKEQRYFLIIWFITTIISFPSISKYTPEIDLRYFTGYLGFVVLGHYLTAHNFSKNFLKYTSLLFISGVLVTIFGTYYMTAQWGKFYGGFYAYLKPNIVLASVGIFFILKDISITNKLYLRAVDFISKYSFGIYLAHVLILTLLSEIGIDWSFIHPFIGIPLTTVVCLLISCLLVFMVNKLPFLGRHVSG